MWEVATGYCVKTYTGHRDWVRMVRVLPAFGGSAGNAGKDIQSIDFKMNKTYSFKAAEAIDYKITEESKEDENFIAVD